MPTEPEISVVIPVFNRATLLKRCVESVLRQTRQDFEIIISDNASTDGTWEVIEQYQRIDKRIRGFRNPENLGPVENWRLGIDRARGRYCKILFSDDYLESGFLEAAAQPLNDTEIGFSYSAALVEHLPGQAKRLAYSANRYCGKRPARGFIQDGLMGLDVPVSPSAGLFRSADVRHNMKMEIDSPFITDWKEHGAGVDQLLYLCIAQQYRYVFNIASAEVTFGNGGDTITYEIAGYRAASRYLQARIWFAFHYKYGTELRTLLTQAWLIEALHDKHISSPLTTSHRYLNDPPSLRLLPFINQAAYAAIRIATHAARRRILKTFTVLRRAC